MMSKLVSAISTLLDQHRGRLLDIGAQRLQVLRAHRAVDHAMIDRQGAAHHVAHDHLALARDRPHLAHADRQDHRLRRIDDGGKAVDAKHAEIGDSESAALKLVEPELADLGAGREVLHLPGDLPQALQVGIAHDRRDQAAVGGAVDPDVARAALGSPAATGAAPGAAPGLANSTSALTMRPFGPLPVIRERASPFSAAMRLASGEARMRPPAGAAAGFAAGAAGATGAGAPGAGARRTGAAGAGLAAGGGAPAAGFGAGAGAGAAPACTPGSPSSTRIPSTAMTATPSAPSGTTIWPILPSSTPPTSMVALAVSISHLTWPDLTVAPTFTCHLASLPSVIVSDSAGIRILIDMP